MKKSAIVLLSGGLDSAVALWWAQSRGWACQAITFDYGQRHNRELKSARRLARRASVPLHVVRFRLPWSESSLTNRHERLPHHTLLEISKHRIPSTYVPGRNTLFLSFAMSFADQIKAEALVIGANALDYSGYPDCRQDYLRAFETVARRGTRLGTEGKKKISVLAPLIKMSKAQIVRLGRTLNVPIELTWSCYLGGRTPCGRCDSCLLREKGFFEAAKKGEK
jgi:7-cyano-7-deazaguanine synthase